MKLALQIAIVMLFSTVQASAQYFNKLYDFESSGDWGSTILPVGSNYFICGSGSSANGDQFIGGMLVDNNGNKLAEKIIIDKSGMRLESAGHVKRLSNGNYLANLVQIQNNATGLSFYGGFALLNPQFDTIFVKGYTDTTIHEEYIWGSDTMAGGNIILGAILQYEGQSYNTNRCLLIKTNGSGDLIWKRTYAVPNSNLGTEFASVETQPDGKLLVGATTRQLKWNGQVPYHLNSPWFLLLDTSGNILHEKYYPIRYGGGSFVCKDNNGGYYHWGVLDTLLTGNPLNIENHPHYFAHLNDSFEFEWLYDFGRPNAKVRIWSVEQIRDSGYIVYGHEAKVGIQLRGYMARFGKTGNMLWERTYTLDTLYAAYIADVYERPDGGFILTGMHKSGGGALHTQDLWVLGVDSLGCPAVQCQWPTAVESLPTLTSGVEIYPNPTKGTFVVRQPGTCHYSLYDLQGRLIESRMLDAQVNTIHLPANCTPGTYLVRCILNDGSAFTNRLIFEP